MTMDGRIYVPKLVKRCREFQSWCEEGIGWKDTNICKKWYGIGIAESINIPEKRERATT
jgi:hypothetical protein